LTACVDGSYAAFLLQGLVEKPDAPTFSRSPLAFWPLFLAVPTLCGLKTGGCGLKTGEWSDRGSRAPPVSPDDHLAVFLGKGAEVDLGQQLQHLFRRTAKPDALWRDDEGIEDALHP
jgi:hypothetical protein